MPIRSLGYLRLRTPNLAAWRGFAADILGFVPGSGGDDGRAFFRWDAYPYRLELVAADAFGFDAIGYEVADDRDLAAVAAQLEAAGVAVTHVPEADARARRVSGLARFTDPDGQAIELFYGPILDHVPCVSPLVSRFETGEMGMGHVVVAVDDLAAASGLYRDVLGFHRRNTMSQGPFSLHFFGCNPRHHTLALIAGIPFPGKLVHFMVEAGTIDDVGRAQDRCLDAGIPIPMGMGKHTNDHMISFYCQTPDGFMVEFGCGGIKIDDVDSETTYEITKTSFWGHRPLKP